MHAFLFVTPSEKDINKKTEEIDGKLIELTLQKIDDVKEINSFLKLKVTETTIILLNNFDNATKEAQNAFLKSLEEPQENLFFILTADNINKVAETIISRCEVVEFQNLKFKITKEDEEKMQNFINAKFAEKILVTSKINKKDEGVEFMKKLIFVSHQDVLQNYKILEMATKTLNNLEANGNVQLQLTNFVVNSRT